MNLIGTLQRVINPAAKIRNAVGRVETLVGIHLPGVVGIGRNLPSTDVDGLQPRLHLLHRLVAGHGAQSIDVFLAVQKFPQALGTEARQRVLDVDRAAQAKHVFRGVRTLQALPARIRYPVMVQCGLGKLILSGAFFVAQHLFDALRD